jgi:ribose 5-phosphate isomerase A
MRTADPDEVVEFESKVTQRSLEAFDSQGQAVPIADGWPFVTDGCNYILDCDFGPIADAARLDERVRLVVGVVESSLFIGQADRGFVAEAEGVHQLHNPRG